MISLSRTSTLNDPKFSKARSSDGGNDDKKLDRSPCDSRASRIVPWGKPLTGQVRHRLNTRLDQAFLKRRQATEPIFVIGVFPRESYTREDHQWQKSPKILDELFHDGRARPLFRREKDTCGTSEIGQSSRVAATDFEPLTIALTGTPDRRRSATGGLNS